MGCAEVSEFRKKGVWMLTNDGTELVEAVIGDVRSEARGAVFGLDRAGPAKEAGPTIDAGNANLEACCNLGEGRVALLDRKSTRLNSSHVSESRMPSSA